MRCASFPEPSVRLVPGAERVCWMTPGEPTFAFYAADRLHLASITLLRPDWERSLALLEGDFLLANPERTLKWLASVTAAEDG